LKILYVVPAYEPARGFAGTVAGFINLCRGLAKNGVDITVYTTDANGAGGHLDVPLNTLVNLSGVKVFYFRCNFGVSKAFYSYTLTERLKETVTRFDLVDVSAIWQWIQVDTSKICKRFGIPYVVSTHGSVMDWGLKEKAWKRLPYWYLFAKKTLKHAVALHFVTEEERHNSEKNIKYTKSSFMVHNCIDCKKFVLQPDKIKAFKKSLDIPQDTFVISNLSLIRKRKGLHLIVEALSYLKNRNISLLIGGGIGEIAYYNQIKNIIKKHNLDARIKWLGFLEQEDLATFYGASNLFVFPSFEEALGLVAVEAMACGTPLLVSKGVPLWREIVEKKAGLAIPFNPKAIANIIEKFLSKEVDIEDYSRNAKALAENKFDVERVATLMIKAYEDILTGTRSPEISWKEINDNRR
jgi:glycosyltransferase involved in cell wall biosynthesis